MPTAGHPSSTARTLDAPTTHAAYRKPSASTPHTASTPAELHRLETTSIKLADLRAAAPEGAELGEIGGSAIELMRRPYISYDLIAKVIGRGEGVTPAMAQRIETEIRYAGYIAREERIIRDIQRHENVKIPDDFDYAPIETMTLESREKLTKIRPRTLAQAGRIPGVSPSDLAQLSIVLLRNK